MIIDNTVIKENEVVDELVDQLLYSIETKIRDERLSDSSDLVKKHRRLYQLKQDANLMLDAADTVILMKYKDSKED